MNECVQLWRRKSIIKLWSMVILWWRLQSNRRMDTEKSKTIWLDHSGRMLVSGPSPSVLSSCRIFPNSRIIVTYWVGVTCIFLYAGLGWERGGSGTVRSRKTGVVSERWADSNRGGGVTRHSEERGVSGSGAAIITVPQRARLQSAAP